MLRNPESFAAWVGLNEFPVLYVSSVRDKGEEDTEHYISKVGVDVVEVGQKSQFLCA